MRSEPRRSAASLSFPLSSFMRRMLFESMTPLTLNELCAAENICRIRSSERSAFTLFITGSVHVTCARSVMASNRMRYSLATGCVTFFMTISLNARLERNTGRSTKVYPASPSAIMEFRMRSSILAPQESDQIFLKLEMSSLTSSATVIPGSCSNGLNVTVNSLSVGSTRTTRSASSFPSYMRLRGIP